MRVCGRDFREEDLRRIQIEADASPLMSRRAFSLQICGWLNWRSPRGGFQDGSCRKALAQLGRRGVLRLPAAPIPIAFNTRKALTLESPPSDLVCQLKDLGKLELTLVTSRYARSAKSWRGLMAKYHYLGEPKACGAQVRYLIRCERFGLLGALSFRSGCLALKARDQWIGWSAKARLANLGLVIQNDRFLIAPSIKVLNLASHVLGKALAQVGADWQERYGVRPVVAETFIDPNYVGTCYHAAGWIGVGTTSPRRNGRPKTILLHPLDPEWKKRLCAEPRIELQVPEVSGASGNWAQDELGRARLDDPRLVRRLVKIAADFYNQPQATLPDACAGQAQTIAAYRFFKNPKVSMDVILTPHVESTIQRMREHAVVLAPQDTTLLDYRGLLATTGLGPTNTKGDHGRGLILHDTMAFTPEGVPLGVLDAQCWARDPAEAGKRERRKELPIEKKESVKWLRSFRKLAEIQKFCPQTRLVSIGDRESDIYELLLEARKDPEGPWLLVRSMRGRQRQTQNESLWNFMSKQPTAGFTPVTLEREKGVAAREAIMAVRFAETWIEPPKDHGHEPVKLWVVYLREENPPGEEPVEWLLQTTAPVETFEAAKERVAWYTGRWGIEVYHRILKSGCLIEEREFGTADSLEACLGVDMVVAWRVYHLTMLGREKPDLPCTIFFEDVEWRGLWCYRHKTPVVPEKAPTMREAVRMVGEIGGHMGRKRDGMPGTECIWRGLQRLDVAADMYAVIFGFPLAKIRGSYPEAMHPPPAGP